MRDLGLLKSAGVEPAFVSPAEAVEPCDAALDDPSVLAELLLGLDAAPGDARPDATAMTGPSATAVIVSFVGKQLVGPATCLPRLPAMGGTASSTFSNGTLLWTLTPVSRTASGCRVGR